MTQRTGGASAHATTGTTTAQGRSSDDDARHDDGPTTRPPDQPTEPARGRDAVAARAIGLTKTYGDGQARVTALDHVDVEFASGQLTAIMGPSGSGKSTLVHWMAALGTPTAGRVIIDGVDITHFKDKALTRLRRDRLGFVFRAYNLIPTLTAHENITLPMDIAGARDRPDLVRHGDRHAWDPGPADTPT